DTFIIDKATGAFLEKKIADKRTMLICADDSDTKEIAIPHRLGMEQCISDEHLIELYHCSLALEKHYAGPQDIEWAIERNNRLYILQTRPLRVIDPGLSDDLNPPRVEGTKVLLNKGVIACRGVGHGRAFVLKHERDLNDFPDGAVLVARHTNPKFVKVMNKASAIVTDIGGVTGHMASLAREYNVPAILNTGTATSDIENGKEITVDALGCNIYEGRVDKLLEYARSRKGPVQRTHMHSVLDSVLKLISPLNLVDPDKENFRPENCRTFHDITRFAHETAMAEMFQTGKGFEIDGIEDFMSSIAFAEAGETRDIELQSIILKAGIPVDVRLIDVEGGVKGRPKKARPDHITSIPFSAFLKGLTNMRWPGPTPGGAHGTGSAAQISSLSKEQLRKTQEKSYAVISKYHMNFSIRLGYHFSMVEAYAGENINDNYIKFFFKGGGAVEDRKLRRVRLIREILETMHFRVNVIDDCVDAMLTKYEQPDIEKILEIMGKFTVYTKQLDMALFNDPIADMFIEDFIRDHIRS
ncbi:MAG: PEP-utilizing enzyme, partial [Nitrospirota bacterium]